MNRAVLTRRLILAQRHAATAEELVDRQRLLVGTLSSSQALPQARTLLRHLEDLHRLCLDDEPKVGFQLANVVLNRWRGH